MTVGFDQRLYILPFDQRESFQTKMFGWEGALSTAQSVEIAAAKQLIYDGFKVAVASGAPKQPATILVDEQFGAAILRDAAHQGYMTACPAEKSGQDYLHGSGRLFMVELYVDAEPAQMERLQRQGKDYDLYLRPGLTVQAIHELQGAGVEPDVWKVEGLERREDCLNLVAAARRNDRDRVGCIMLGGGQDEKRVLALLATAASVSGFIGFAVGRTTFWDPLADWRAKRIARSAALAEIARRYRQWVDIFERAHG